MANTTKGLKRFVQEAMDAGQIVSKAGTIWLKKHHGITMRPQVFGRIRKQLDIDQKAKDKELVRTQPLRTDGNQAGRPTPVDALITEVNLVVPQAIGDNTTFTGKHVREIIDLAVGLGRLLTTHGDVNVKTVLGHLLNGGFVTQADL